MRVQRYAIIPYRPAKKIILSPHKSHFSPHPYTKSTIYNILINNTLPPPAKLFISTIPSHFSREGSHFGCEGIKVIQNDSIFAAQILNPK